MARSGNLILLFHCPKQATRDLPLAGSRTPCVFSWLPIVDSHKLGFSHISDAILAWQSRTGSWFVPISSSATFTSSAAYLACHAQNHRRSFEHGTGIHSFLNAEFVDGIVGDR